MNKQLLSVSMTLPFLLLQVSQAFASTDTATAEVLHLVRQNSRTAQVTLDNQQLQSQPVADIREISVRLQIWGSPDQYQLTNFDQTDNQQPPAFMLAGRDDQEEQRVCRWVGSCDDKEISFLPG